MMNSKWFVFVDIWMVITADESIKYRETEYGDDYGYQESCINILKIPLTMNERVGESGARMFSERILRLYIHINTTRMILNC